MKSKAVKTERCWQKRRFRLVARENKTVEKKTMPSVLRLLQHLPRSSLSFVWFLGHVDVKNAFLQFIRKSSTLPSSFRNRRNSANNMQGVEIRSSALETTWQSPRKQESTVFGSVLFSNWWKTKKKCFLRMYVLESKFFFSYAEVHRISAAECSFQKGKVPAR